MHTCSQAICYRTCISRGPGESLCWACSKRDPSLRILAPDDEEARDVYSGRAIFSPLFTRMTVDYRPSTLCRFFTTFKDRICIEHWMLCYMPKCLPVWPWIFMGVCCLQMWRLYIDSSIYPCRTALFSCTGWAVWHQCCAVNAIYDVRLNKLMYCLDWAVLFGCDDNDKLIKSKLGAEADITYKKLLFLGTECNVDQNRCSTST